MGAYRVAEAKAHPSEILRKVEAGPKVTITRRGPPIATVEPARKAPAAIDWARIAELRDKLPKSKLSAARLVREMRDAGF